MTVRLRQRKLGTHPPPTTPPKPQPTEDSTTGGTAGICLRFRVHFFRAAIGAQSGTQARLHCSGKKRFFSPKLEPWSWLGLLLDRATWYCPDPARFGTTKALVVGSAASSPLRAGQQHAAQGLLHARSLLWLWHQFKGNYDCTHAPPRSTRTLFVNQAVTGHAPGPQTLH